MTRPISTAWPDGPLADRVEGEIDAIAVDIDNGRLDFWLWVGKDYHAECAASAGRSGPLSEGPKPGQS